MKAEAVVEVRPTENLEKVKRALLNVFEPDRIEVREEGGRKLIVATGSGPKALKKLRDAIWRQGIHDSARSILARSIAGEGLLSFSVNKQAAFVGVVSLVTEPNESPLGPIAFKVEVSDVRQFLDWIAPRTYKGRIFYEGPPPD